MDMVELGKRIKLARIQVLKMNQKELAEKLSSYQALISRLEKGIGGSMELVLDFITLLNKQGLSGHMLFAQKFSIEQVAKNTKVNRQQMPDRILAEKLSVLKNSLQTSHDHMMEIDSLFELNSPAKKK